ncbi:hypothetical protein CLLI_02950 [Clostridium liquoris]|jgi:hypothetical protein|uniref:Ribose 5-phosphate isomerase n=2 Tax=Clostridium liquoris TaxID=1289519 RepID=A0A2T0B959_9CLOT|nr:hypothetical protein CLLI_02950 [Clostridium liquoris]
MELQEQSFIKMKYFDRNIKYEKIIELLCEYKGIHREELITILEDEECKYLLFLLLKKYNCMDIQSLAKDFEINNRRKLNSNLKKAEEKFLLNKKIREMFFEAENIIEKIQ